MSKLSAQPLALDVAEKLGLEKWLNYVGLTVADALSILYFLLIGFVFGFVFKKYFKFVIGCAFVITILVILLDSRHLITIDWVGIKNLIGLDPAKSDLNNLWKMGSDWAYANLYPLIGGLVGFVFGYKLG